MHPDGLGADPASQVGLKFIALILSHPLEAGIRGVSYHTQLMNVWDFKLHEFFCYFSFMLASRLGVHLSGSVLD